LQQSYVLQIWCSLFNCSEQIAEHPIICADLRLVAPSGDELVQRGVDDTRQAAQLIGEFGARVLVHQVGRNETRVE
jgi:hypothetical protein